MPNPGDQVCAHLFEFALFFIRDFKLFCHLIKSVCKRGNFIASVHGHACLQITFGKFFCRIFKHDGFDL